MKNKIDFNCPNFSTQLYKFDEDLRFNICTYIELEAKDNAPYNYSESKGNKAHYRDKIEKNENNTAVIAHANYSAAIEYGIEPNDKKVFPVRAKALKFKVNGKEIFAKWAKPFKNGRKPNPVMRNAARTVMKRDFSSIYDRLFKKYF